MKRGLTLEPLNDFNLMEMGLAHYFARQNDQAIEQARRAIGVDPASYWSHMVLGWAEEQRGEFSAAIQEFTEAKRLSLGEISQVIGSLGHASALAGQRQQALDAIAALQQLSKHSYVSPYDFALIYAGLGDKENALLWLEKAYDDRCGWLALWLKVDPKFDSLRTELRFQKLLQRIGFPSVP
jgi:tetratricopeptide (TPR) repeat protein